MRIILAIALLLVAGPAPAREPDSPCLTCCAQLKDYVAQQGPGFLDASRYRDEIVMAMTAGKPGDPLAEIHCMAVLQKLKSGN